MSESISSMDKDNFFHQCTIRICGDLDIEKALWACMEYLEEVIPLTGIALFLLDLNLSTSRTVAQVTRFADDFRFSRIISLGRRAGIALIKNWSKLPIQDVMVINRPALDPVAKAVADHINKQKASIMIMRLKTEEKSKIGVLSFYTDENDLYTDEHARLLSLLHDPFAIAMANALKHEEVLNYKDMLADDIQYLHKELLHLSGDEVIGKDGGLKEVMEMVRQVASLDRPVLLLGETGVGKEVVANVIHYFSNRKDGPFIKLNCGAIPETLIDSELFGHEKGAFTGAVTENRGRFERAHKGTILLDEIGELPLNAQVKLLRVLQSKEIERVGGSKPIHVDARIICATHRNLEHMVKQGHFREDLWYRLNLFPIIIPPLRQRREDIPALLNYFIYRKSKELKFHNTPALSPGVVDRLKAYDWPGNVRELENVVERALIQNRGQTKKGLLTFDLFNLRQNTAEEQFPSGSKEYLPTIDELISSHIQRVLKLTKGRIEGERGASEILGMNPSTLRFRMKKLGIQATPYKRRRQ